VTGTGPAGMGGLTQATVAGLLDSLSGHLDRIGARANETGDGVVTKEVLPAAADVAQLRVLLKP